MSAPESARPARRDLALPRGQFSLCDWGGAGPLLHLAHANGFCAASYTPLATRLVGAARVVGADLRGHGLTAALAEPATLRDWSTFADDLAEVFASFGEPVIAAGHSLGGVASLMVAATRPELVRALVLLDPTIFPRSWRWPLAVAKRLGLGHRFPIAARAAARRGVWPSRDTVARAFRGKPTFSGWEEESFAAFLDCSFAAQTDGRLQLRCAPAWEAQVFATTPHNVWRLLPRLACPVLLVYGESSDTFRGPAARDFARRVPHAQLMPVPGASHFVPQERPDEVARAVVDFVARVTARGT